MRVAIIGTGKIGTDLLYKLEHTKNVDIVAFVGRRVKQHQPKYYSSDGIDFFINNPNCCDVVFDCTDAQSAIVNNSVFASQGIKVIDLTPSKQGFMCVPNVNCDYVLNKQNISMITCGGQISIPLIYFLTKHCDVDYVEVVTQISSTSAGMATRMNVDEYIHTTEYAIEHLTGITQTKVVLNINPSADAYMKTTVLVKTKNFKITQSAFDNFKTIMQSYVQGYNIEEPLVVSDCVVSIASYILNLESDLPGNLDIINRAAVQILKKLMTYKLNGE
jgi:acetaldehyde dehydrogenase